MNTEELKIQYPTIAKATSLYKLQQIQSGFKELQSGANNLIYDEVEKEYLDQLELFIANEYCSQITKIKKRQAQIERTKNFDISKVQYLPPDMIGEIKSYLQPEIKYATRFTMLRSIQQRYTGLWEVEYNLMGNVPKKILMDLVEKCNIYPTMSVRSKDQKEKWCRMIVEEIGKWNYEKSITRTDKLLALHNEEWSSTTEKKIDKWYKFFLYIIVYKKYRVELATSIHNKTEKLNILKNKKIVVK
jgi:hypothetical protein